MKRVSCILLLTGCAGPVAAPPRPSARAPAERPPLPLALGEYGDYCVVVRGSAFCGDLRFDEPLAKGPPAGGFTDVVQVSLGGAGTRCLVRRSGAVHCTGENGSGQLGAGLRDDRVNDWPEVLGVHDARSVSVGPSAACAVDGQGAVWCWGDNRSGQTGDHVAYAHDAVELARATRVSLAAPARRVEVGLGASCALLAGGQVACWGRPPELAAGTAMPPETWRPHVLGALGTWTSLSANEEGFCGLDAAGHVACVGRVEPLADDFALHALTLERLATAVSHACGVAKDGGVWCFGRGSYGVLGRDPDQVHRDERVRVDGVPPAMDVVTSNFVSCAHTRAGEIWCWGGELRDGQPERRPPTRLALE